MTEPYLPINEISLVQLNEVLLAEDRAVLIDLWGPSCAPCRALRSHLEQLASERTADWRFVAVNADGYPELAQRYGVQATPTLVFVTQGDEVHRFTGTITPSAVDEALDAHTPG